MRKLVLVVLVATSLVAPQLANALVMCGPKKPDGTLREGAPIRLRTVCRSNELQLDPVALGLQGPVGATGPAGQAGGTGAQGPTGPVGPRGGATMVDANGLTLGTALQVERRGAATVVVGAAEVAGVLKPITVTMNQGSFYGGPVFFESTDCSGTPLVEASSHEFVLEGTPFGPLPANVGAGALLYYPIEQWVGRTVRSRSDPRSQSDCGVMGGLFIPPISCCLSAAQWGFPTVMTVAAAATLDLGAFEAPFNLTVTE